MSTTLIPPTRFEFTPYGGRTQRHETLAALAREAAATRPIGATVVAVTGERRRALTAREVRELSAELRAARHRAESRAREAQAWARQQAERGHALVPPHGGPEMYSRRLSPSRADEGGA